jgi:hypothetical protein
MVRTFATYSSLAILIALARPAAAVDEIQVYNAGIAAPGQFTIQQHLNYVAKGLKEPDFPGGFPSDHSLNGTPEFAYGVTDWWEVGLYLPFAVQNRQFLSDAFKLRTLFVSPNADHRNLFYGVNFEFSNPTPKFSQSRFALEIRPILGVRTANWEFIVNPIVDISFGQFGEADFAPAARLAYQVQRDFFLGVEYYGDLGRIGASPKPSDQQHTLFAVTDFKAGILDIDLGIGYGLTQGSDRVVIKAIIGYAFPVPEGKPDQAASHLPTNPVSRSHAELRSAFGP